MIERINVLLRKGIGSVFPNRFPKLYSTLDHPLEVPVQISAYRLALEKYILPGDCVLDVGFGLGYGLRLMAEKAFSLTGIDIDPRAVKYGKSTLASIKNVNKLQVYDGKKIPFPDSSFDIVTCIDVIEHVPDYTSLLIEMVRVSKRVVLISTPNRRPEYTLPDGRPKNIWHLREWSFDEFDRILYQIPGVEIEWSFINGPYTGPLYAQQSLTTETQALTPALIRLPTD